MAENYCAHPECNCEVEAGKGVSKGGEHFCSQHCANAGTSNTDECECGHDECE